MESNLINRVVVAKHEVVPAARHPLGQLDMAPEVADKLRYIESARLSFTVSLNPPG
jgi:hypothetical protein